MKNLSLVFLLLLCPFLIIRAQFTFNETFGGESDERAMAVTECKFGGYAVVGLTYSFGAGKSDIWAMRLDKEGKEVWRKYLGDTDFDWANSVVETEAGNLVIAGFTRNRTTRTHNAWVIQLDGDGNTLWSHTYGGEKADEAKSIVQTADGGFAIAGETYSYGKGKKDIWLLKLNQYGEEMWQRTFGGKEEESALSIIEAQDGSLVMGGYTQSLGKGKADIMILKVDANGKGIWKKNFGGTGNETVEGIVEADNGDFLLAGWTNTNSQGKLDAMVMRINTDGQPMWKKNYGGAGKDAFSAICKAYEGGYALAGYTSISDDKPSRIWLTKIDEKGNKIWERKSNSKKNDFGYALTNTRDGGYLLAGSTQTLASSGSDIWVLKTNHLGSFKNNFPVAYQEPEPVPQIQIKATEEEEGDIFKPNLYVVSVGVSAYEDSDVNLTFAHTDAAAIANKFSTLEGSIFNKVHVKTLLNKDATLINIKVALSWLEREATQKDVILVFISSHGALDNKGNLYILPTDFSEYNLFATALNIRDITEGTNGVPCKKLILLDACHSGQSGSDFVEFASIKALDVNSVVKELMSKEPGVTVMTSSSGREYSYENPRWGHGAFTKAILEGLDGGADFNKNSVIHLTELELFVSERVKELTGGRQHPYTPIKLSGNIPLYLVEE